MLGALALMLSNILRAEEVDLDKPVATDGSKGSVVFSLTTWGTIQERSYIKWRSLDGNGRSGQISVRVGAVFGNESFSEAGLPLTGRLVRFELPAGNYEFYSFNSDSYQKSLTGNKEFSRRFVVTADQIQYIGNLDLLATHPVFSAKAILAAAFIGTWFGTVDVYPSLLDASERDIPMLAAQGVATDNMPKNVTPNDDDVRTAALIQTLKDDSDKGDLAATSRLLFGTQVGWFMSESGEEFKLMPDQELKRKLAEQLAHSGVPGGAFLLGEESNPLVNKKITINPEEGARILEYYLADAGKYYWPAFARIADIYDDGIPGVEENGELSRQWWKRLRAVKLPTEKTIPYLDQEGKAEFRKFLDAPIPCYFAVSTRGAFGLSEGDAASAKEAISACETRNEGSTDHCRLFAKHRWLFWQACPAELQGPQATTFPPTSKTGKITVMTQPPKGVTKTSKAMFQDFLASNWPRAYAYSENGEAVMESGDCQAAYRALQLCRERTGQPCQLYALDDQLVQDDANPQLIGEAQRLADLVEQTSQRTTKLASQLLPADKQIEEKVASEPAPVHSVEGAK